MGCACGKKKGQVSVFSTEEQSRIAKERNVRVASSAASRQARAAEWNQTNQQADSANTP